MPRDAQLLAGRRTKAIYSLSDLLTLRKEAQVFLDRVQSFPQFLEAVDGLPVPPSGLDRSLSDARRRVARVKFRSSSERAAWLRDIDGWTEYIVRVEDAGAMLMCEAQWSGRALHDAIRSSESETGCPRLVVPSTLATRTWVLSRPVDPGPPLAVGRALSESELVDAMTRLDQARASLRRAVLDGVDDIGIRTTYGDVMSLHQDSEAEVDRLREHARTSAEVAELQGTTSSLEGDEVQLSTVARLQGDRQKLWAGAERAVRRRLAGETVPSTERSAARHAREYLNAAVNGARFAQQPVDITDPVTPAARRAGRTEYLQRLQALHRRAQTRVRLSDRARR